MTNSAVLSPSTVSVTMSTTNTESRSSAEVTRKYSSGNSNDQTTVLLPQAHKKPSTQNSIKGQENTVRSGEIRGTRVRSGRSDAKISSQKVIEAKLT